MKLKNKLNTVDCIICIFIILMAALLTVRYSDEIRQAILSGTGSSRIGITVKTQPFKKEYSENLAVGQPVINFDNGVTIGTLSNVSLYDSIDDAIGDGDYVYAVLTIDSEAKKDGKHYMIGDDKVLVNGVTRFALPDLFFEGEIISMDSLVDSLDSIER